MLKISLDSTNIGVVKVFAKNHKFGLDNACAVQTFFCFFLFFFYFFFFFLN